MMGMLNIFQPGIQVRQSSNGVQLMLSVFLGVVVPALVDDEQTPISLEHLQRGHHSLCYARRERRKSLHCRNKNSKNIANTFFA